MAEDTQQAQALRDVRDKLCMLLEDSDLYDARHVLEEIGHTELWDEQVVLHSKVRAVWDGPGRPESPILGPMIHKRAGLQSHLGSQRDDLSPHRTSRGKIAIFICKQDLHCVVAPGGGVLLKLRLGTPLHQVPGTSCKHSRP